MDIFLTYLKVFLIGGGICAICQIIIDKTAITAARLLAGLVTLGVILSAVGIYGPFVEFAGAGATVPLLGFGHALCRGTFRAVSEEGLLGVLTGGIKATAAGVAAAIFFGLLNAVIFRSRSK